MGALLLQGGGEQMAGAGGALGGGQERGVQQAPTRCGLLPSTSWVQLITAPC